MRAEDYLRALEGVVAARNWVDARIAELPGGAGQVDVMALADRDDAPTGLAAGLAVLGTLAMLPDGDISRLAAELRLEPDEADWLRVAARSLRERSGTAGAARGAQARAEERADLENPIVAINSSPEFYLATNTAAMTVILVAPSGPALRIKEPVTGHLATAWMLIDRCADAYELCKARAIRLPEEELADLRSLLGRTLGCVRRICAATGTEFDALTSPEAADREGADAIEDSK